MDIYKTIGIFILFIALGIGLGNGTNNPKESPSTTCNYQHYQSQLNNCTAKIAKTRAFYDNLLNISEDTVDYLQRELENEKMRGRGCIDAIGIIKDQLQTKEETPAYIVVER